MNYYFSKSVSLPFYEAVELMKEALTEEGFGIVSEMDMQTTLKTKLNKEFKRYTVIGACHAPLAYEALLVEDKIGIMMPCNVILVEQPGGFVEASVFNPVVLSDVVKNDRLDCFTTDLRGKLRRALSRL